MGMIASSIDRYSSDIEVITAPGKSTGIWERVLSTVGGGAMTCVMSDKIQIRVFHDSATHGSYVILVDGDIDIRIERCSKEEMLVRFTRSDGTIITACHLNLKPSVSQTIQSPHGRFMTFRRFWHHERLLDDLLARVNI